MSIIRTSYEKILSVNDTGGNGTHQAGIHIPKSETGLLQILPFLDPAIYNPSAKITVKGSDGNQYQLRFIYYNNRIHGRGTRNEYRLTCLTGFLRHQNSNPGDAFRITRDENGCLSMDVIKNIASATTEIPDIIHLRGWSLVC